MPASATVQPSGRRLQHPLGSHSAATGAVEHQAVDCERTLVTKKQAEQRSTQRLTCVMRRPSGVASRSPIYRLRNGLSGYSAMRHASACHQQSG